MSPSAACWCSPTGGAAAVPASANPRPRVAQAVALAHDLLVTRGGAERVVVSLARAFPNAPIHTAMYDPDRCYPELRQADIHPLGIDRVPGGHRFSRLLLPLLPAAYRRRHVDAAVVVCSTGGWSHHISTTGVKIAYCYSPHPAVYPEAASRPQRPTTTAVLSVLRTSLVRADQRAAATVSRWLAISSETARRIKQVYRADAEVVHPPVTIDVDGPQRAVLGVEPGHYVCVSRLLPYKHVDKVVAAAAQRPDRQFVIVGRGQMARTLERGGPDNVRLVGMVDDDQLRWLYATCAAVVAPAQEDYGLTPIEGTAFGKPTVALRWGGYLDTVIEGATGVFFDVPTPRAIADAIKRLEATTWSPADLKVHAARFSEAAFIERMRAIVAEARAA